MDYSVSASFDGVRHDTKNNISFLIFSHGDYGSRIIVEVPVSSDVAYRVMKYIEKLFPPTPKPAERGNDEPSS